MMAVTQVSGEWSAFVFIQGLQGQMSIWWQQNQAAHPQLPVRQARRHADPPAVRRVLLGLAGLLRAVQLLHRDHRQR